MIRQGKFLSAIAIAVLIICGVPPNLRAGSNPALEIMIAELKKQDTATFSDAVAGLWRERIQNDSGFCGTMKEDTSALYLWLAGVKQTAFVATSDTAVKRIENWRASVLDTIYGPFSGLKSCRQIDSSIYDLFSQARILTVPVSPALTSAWVTRRGSFLIKMWKNRSRIHLRETGSQLFDLLLDYPNEIYDLFSASRPELSQLIAYLDEIRFTAEDDSSAAALELFRRSAITRLSSGVVGNRFGGLNDPVLERLKKIRITRLP